MQYRELTAERIVDWLDAGFQQRDFFPHRAFYLRKAAPDGSTLANRSGLRPGPDALWEIAMFAIPPALDGLPRDLFFDDDIQWHRQHFGLEGHVGVASVVVRGRELYTAAHHSDLVQRIARRREFKTRVDKRFHGWDRLLLNSVLAFALEHGMSTVNVPTARWARSQTDEARHVEDELFDRVYDRHVRDVYDVRDNGDWWAIDVDANRRRIVLGRHRDEPRTRAKTICVCHDVERGLGHRQVEPEFALQAESSSGESLRAMLAIEQQFGVRATYNVVGVLVDDVRDEVGAGGHCLGFHTYDHHLERRGWRSVLDRFGLRATDGVPKTMQLARCRTIDHRAKGYRPAQSTLGPDTDEGRLAHHNFEWLASSARSLGIVEPRLENGIVKIPIRFDDFALHRALPYHEWEARALERIRGADFVAFSLHDCYGRLWLDHYPRLIDFLHANGELKTLDEVAAEVTLENAA